MMSNEHCGLTPFTADNIPEEWAPLPVFSIAIPVNFLLVRLVFKSRRK